MFPRCLSWIPERSNKRKKTTSRANKHCYKLVWRGFSIKPFYLLPQTLLYELLATLPPKVHRRWNGENTLKRWQLARSDFALFVFVTVDCNVIIIMIMIVSYRPYYFRYYCYPYHHCFIIINIIIIITNIITIIVIIIMILLLYICIIVIIFVIMIMIISIIAFIVTKITTLFAIFIISKFLCLEIR